MAFVVDAFVVAFVAVAYADDEAVRTFEPVPKPEFRDQNSKKKKFQ